MNRQRRATPAPDSGPQGASAESPLHPADQPVTEALRTWIRDQAAAGCRADDVLAALCASGWHRAVAVRALAQVVPQWPAAPPPSVSAEAADAALALEEAHWAPVTPVGPMPTPHLLGEPTTVCVAGRTVKVLMTLALPQVVLFGDFLSDDECETLMSLAHRRLVRSETVVNRTGGSEVNAARTSDGMFFGRGENPLCRRIEARIAALLHWPVERGEGLQVLRYRPGAEYRPHHDYFDPRQPGAASILARGGQRVGTLVMYLNTPDKGGATVFPEVGLAVAPVRGQALFFAYDRPEPGTRTLHGGAPVIQGEKWVATKWLREGLFR